MFTGRYIGFAWLTCVFLLAGCPSDGGHDEPGADVDAGSGGDDATDTDTAETAAADGGTRADSGHADGGTTKPTPSGGSGGSGAMSGKPGGAAGSGSASMGMGMETGTGTGTGTGMGMGDSAASGQRFWLPTPEPTNTTFPRVEVDSKGGVHAAFPAHAVGNAFYAYCPNNCADPSKMKVVTLPTDGTVYTAMLALTADGHPRLILPTFLKIYYAECDTNCTDDANWTVSVIVEHQGDKDVTGDALALDSKGHPRFLMHTYLAYLGVGQKEPETSYAQCDSDCTSAASWNISTISDQIWQSSTLKIDAKDQPHVGTVLVDLDKGTKQLAYLNCTTDCTTTDGWNGIGFGEAFEDQVQELKPAISLALTPAGGARVVALGKLDDGGRGLVYYECDQQCEEDNWRSALISNRPQLGSGVDVAVDAKGHTRFVFTLADNIGLYSCDAADCTKEGDNWTLTKVEFATDLPPDTIILYPNCTIDAWVLHDPTLALAPDGSPRIGYQATDLSGGFTTTDPTKPACVAGKDMTLSRMATLPALK